MHLAQIIITPPPQLTNDVIGYDYKTFLGNFVSRAILFGIILAGIFFFTKLVNAGYTYLTSLGEPAKIQSATKEITNATIGFILMLSIFFIVKILEKILGIEIFKIFI